MTGAEAREKRRELGLSSRELGEEFGVHQDTVWRMEKRPAVPGYWALGLRGIELERMFRAIQEGLKK